jgi:hypothetical protein
MEIVLLLNIILWLAGFVLPVPCFALAFRGWLSLRNTPAASAWRRWTSQVAFFALAAGLAFWIYVLVRQSRGADFYGTTVSIFGASGSALLIALSAFSEEEVRLWLILGSLGPLFFFGISTGEAAI